MKVKELIYELQGMNPDRNVCLSVHLPSAKLYVELCDDIKIWTKQEDEKKVFIGMRE